MLTLTALFALSTAVVQAQNYSSEDTVTEYPNKGTYYHDRFVGRKTSSGEIFDQNLFTAAHWKIKFGTLVLVDVMRKHGCKNIIFSSSATVYGDPAEIPITESCPKGQCTNPYGWTKSMLEQVLMDIQKADPEWNVVLLRYFNPVGAHRSGRIGENPNGIPNNLMPYITQVAVGKRPELGVFGDDYDTPDGTGVRDYIHVCDLAAAHVAALQCFTSPSPLNLKPSTLNHTTPSIYNIGTGHGYSVLDMVKAFVRVNGVEVPYRIQPRRAGDIATCYCDPAKAKAELGWEAKYGIDEMVRDSWNWQRQNPEGYGDA